MIVDITVNFRAKLRQLAIESNSGISKKEIFKLCDSLRDDLSLANIAVQVSQQYKLSLQFEYQKMSLKFQDSSKSSSWKYEKVIKESQD